MNLVQILLGRIMKWFILITKIKELDPSKDYIVDVVVVVVVIVSPVGH